jgi:hypothetical protein
MDVAVNQEGWVEEVRPGSTDPERDFREAGRKYLQALEQELDACKSKVSRLDAALHAAMSERDAVQAKVNALHDLLTTKKTGMVLTTYGGSQPAPKVAVPGSRSVTTRVMDWVLSTYPVGTQVTITKILKELRGSDDGLYSELRLDRNSQVSEALRRLKFHRVGKGTYVRTGGAQS